MDALHRVQLHGRYPYIRSPSPSHPSSLPLVTPANEILCVWQEEELATHLSKLLSDTAIQSITPAKASQRSPQVAAAKLVAFRIDVNQLSPYRRLGGSVVTHADRSTKPGTVNLQPLAVVGLGQQPTQVHMGREESVAADNLFGQTDGLLARMEAQLKALPQIALADLVPYNKNSKTPLYAAVSQRDTALVELVLARDSFEPVNPLSQLHRIGPRAYAPMHAAAVSGFPDMIKLLHEKGADVNQRTAAPSPLQIAVTKLNRPSRKGFPTDHGAACAELLRLGAKQSGIKLSDKTKTERDSQLAVRPSSNAWASCGVLMLARMCRH